MAWLENPLREGIPEQKINQDLEKGNHKILQQVER